MSSQPRVSIVMPVYNGGRFFEMALQSALAQTYRNFEIIIVNDGSTDKGHTDGVARRFAKAHADRITYIDQPNKGVSGALNAGIDAMSGAFFCWLSHDDLFTPEKLSVQIGTLDRIGRDDVVLYGDWEYIDADGKLMYPVVLDSPELRGISLAPVLGGAVNGCTTMIPRKLFEAGHRFDETYRHVQDYRLWRALAGDATFVRQPGILVKQRLHADQDSHRLKDEAVVEGSSFWKDLILESSSVERAAMDGSDLRFLRRMEGRLAQMPYPEALAAVRHAADEALSGVTISVIQSASPASDDRAQERPFSITEFKSGVGERARSAPTLLEAFKAARGAYIVLAGEDAGESWEPLKRQADAMAREGKLISIAGARGAGKKGSSAATTSLPELAISGPPLGVTTMMHRYVVASGMFDPLDVDDEMSGNWQRVFSRFEALNLGASRGAPN